MGLARRLSVFVKVDISGRMLLHEFDDILLARCLDRDQAALGAAGCRAGRAGRGNGSYEQRGAHQQRGESAARPASMYVHVCFHKSVPQIFP